MVDPAWVTAHAFGPDHGPGESKYKHLRRTFPHPVESPKAMRATPAGDRLLFALGDAAAAGWLRTGAAACSRCRFLRTTTSVTCLGRIRGKRGTSFNAWIVAWRRFSSGSMAALAPMASGHADRRPREQRPSASLAGRSQPVVSSGRSPRSLAAKLRSASAPPARRGGDRARVGLGGEARSPGRPAGGRHRRAAVVLRAAGSGLWKALPDARSSRRRRVCWSVASTWPMSSTCAPPPSTARPTATSRGRRSSAGPSGATGRAISLMLPPGNFFDPRLDVGAGTNHGSPYLSIVRSP